MTLILFIISVSLVSAVLGYRYLRTIQQLRTIKARLNLTETELSKVRQDEQVWRDSASDLQTRLDVALTDSITDVLGWQLFEDRVNQSVKESQRYHYTLGIMYIDIDDFHLVTDALGIEIGNALLREVATRIQASVRQVDSVSRSGKDRFVVLLPQLNKPETAAIVAQRMLQSLSESFMLGEREIYITSCIGIAIFPTDGHSTEELFRCAELALQMAKESGHQHYQFYQERMHLDSQRELTLVTDLRGENAEREFVIYYQPIMNVQTETIFCMEAFLHWQHPQLGLIDQRELFNYADKQSKLDDLCIWLLRHACQQFLNWRTLGFAPSLLAITVSFKQLSSSQFIYSISQVLKELAFDPACLVLQIHGGASPTSFDVLEKGFNMLNYMGVKRAILDFGVTAFNLRDLKRFPMQLIKLDPSLIDAVEQDENTIALIKSALYLAKAFSMHLIVQGVETAEQMLALKALGCELMQGKWIAEPVIDKEMPMILYQ